MKEPDVSVVVVTWNSERYVGPLLDSIPGASERLALEVIFVDNNSGDGTVKLLKQRAVEIDHLKLLSWNRGYTGGCNLGFSLSSGRYALLLNPDTELTPGCLDVAVPFMEQHRELSALAPVLLNPDGTEQSSLRGFPTYSAVGLEMTGLTRVAPSVSRWKLSGVPSEPSVVEQPMASALLLRRADFDAAGLYSTGFRTFFGDVDLLYRLRGRVWLHPDFRVIHHTGGSTRLDRPRMALDWSLGLSRWFGRHGGSRLKNVPLHILNWTVGAARALYYRLK